MLTKFLGNEWSMNEYNCVGFRPAIHCLAMCTLLKVSGTKLEGKAGQSQQEVPKHFHFPPFTKMLLHKCFNSKETLLCFCGILPVWPINTLIRKSQKLTHYRLRGLKSKRGLSNAHSSSEIQKGNVPVHTCCLCNGKGTEKIQKWYIYGISY